MLSITHSGLLQPFEHRPALAADLLLICPRRSTALWAAREVELGPDSVVFPRVLGPTQTPVVTDPDRARARPELAVTLAHGSDHPQRDRVLDAFLAAMQALEAVDLEQAGIYHDVVNAVLPKAARRYLERLMSTGTYQFQSEWALRHINRGKAEGRVEDVLTVLATRGVTIPAEARDRITGCTDLDQLDAWLRRAVNAGSIDDVFAT